MNVSAENIRLIFGLKLHELRTTHKYSLSELSAKTGISKSYLNEIEKGKKYPKPEKITHIAQVFGVSYEYLVSLDLSKRLSPISDLVKSNLLTELPLEFFGIKAIDLLNLLATAPTKFSAFVDAIIQIGREHDIHVESLYFSVLRSYQEMHDNYFPEIESAAKHTRKKYGLSIQNETLKNEIEDILVNTYGYTIYYDQIPNKEALSSVRYLFIEGRKPKLLMHYQLDHRQKLFILARELGICEIGLIPRNYTSSWITSQSFSHVLNNFKAYYFASALILDERFFTKGLVDFTKNTTFDPSEVIALMHKSLTSAEPFMLRITNLVPRYFRFSQLFFIRYNENINDHIYKMTKVLHGSGISKSSAAAIELKACQRWAAITSLTKFSKSSGSQPVCFVYRLSYENVNKEYLLIAVTQKMLPTRNMNSCTMVGFLINDRFAEKSKFLDDSSIEKHCVTHQWLLDHDYNIEDGMNKSELMEHDLTLKQTNKAIQQLMGTF